MSLPLWTWIPSSGSLNAQVFRIGRGPHSFFGHAVFDLARFRIDLEPEAIRKGGRRLFQRNPRKRSAPDRAVLVDLTRPNEPDLERAANRQSEPRGQPPWQLFANIGIGDGGWLSRGAQSKRRDQRIPRSCHRAPLGHFGQSIWFQLNHA